MGAEDKIGKLRALLDRVRTRAAAPRVAAAPPPGPEPLVASSPELEIVVEEDLVDITLTAPELTPSASQPDLEISDADFELSAATEVTPSEPLGTQPELDVTALEEEAPESAPRSLAIAAAIGEALSSAPDKYSLEEPLKTPPPESGRQELTPAPAAVSEAREIEVAEEDLEAELSAEEFAPLPPQASPTMEQLGQVVDLEGAHEPAAPLELERAAASPPTPTPAAAIRPAPARPPSARPEGAAPPAPAPAPGPTAQVTALPQTYERPEAPSVTVASFSAPAVTREPETFLELLDASLSL